MCVRHEVKIECEAKNRTTNKDVAEEEEEEEKPTERTRTAQSHKVRHDLDENGTTITQCKLLLDN